MLCPLSRRLKTLKAPHSAPLSLSRLCRGRLCGYGSCSEPWVCTTDPVEPLPSLRRSRVCPVLDARNRSDQCIVCSALRHRSSAWGLRCRPRRWFGTSRFLGRCRYTVCGSAPRHSPSGYLGTTIRGSSRCSPQSLGYRQLPSAGGACMGMPRRVQAQRVCRRPQVRR